MFDIGFSEIVVIAVVALIVIGPERLPKTARTLGHLFGRLQRYVADVKADINREIQLDELKKLQQEVRSRPPRSSPPSPPSRATSRPASAAWNRSSTRRRCRRKHAAAHADAGASSVPEASAPAAADAGEPPRQASLPGLDRG